MTHEAYERLAIGLSSGTSADGVDAALVAFEGTGSAARTAFAVEGAIAAEGATATGAPAGTGVRGDAGSADRSGAGMSAPGRAGQCHANESAACVAAHLVRFTSFEYEPSLRRAILRAAGGEPFDAIAFSRLDAAVGEAFAGAARELARDAAIDLPSLDFIASHGQTIAHAPAPHREWGTEIRATWQLGSLAVIAERTGARTVGNFRARDVAAGGEGAPLLPYVDWALFRSAAEGRALLNIGGIANATFLPCNAAAEDVAAFDLGPGNMLMDAIVVKATGGADTMDVDGRMAAAGHVSRELLDDLLRHPFFDRPPPRSTGREEFGSAVVAHILARGLPVEDAVATACAFTAHAICREMLRWGPRGGPAMASPAMPSPGMSSPVMSLPGQYTSGPRSAGGGYADAAALARDYPAVHISGGGGENRTLVSMLVDLLKPVELRPFDELGVPSRAREAYSFAVLGNECLAGVPANLPRVTGARRRVILGEIVPA